MSGVLRFSPMTLTNAHKNGKRFRQRNRKLRRRRIDFMLFPNPLVKVSCPENEMKTHTEKRDSIESSTGSVKNPIKQSLWTPKGSFSPVCRFPNSNFTLFAIHSGESESIFLCSTLERKSKRQKTLESINHSDVLCLIPS
jgi:hypothetical protein